MFTIKFFYMSGIPVAYEINIDDIDVSVIRDSNLVDVELPRESDHIGTEISNNVISAYNLSRGIKMCIWTSGFLSLLYCTYNFYFLIPLLITICGWFGADTYSIALTSIYLLYTISFTVSQSYLVFSQFSSLDASQRSNYSFLLFLVCLTFFINMWLILILIKFLLVLNKLDSNILTRLKKRQIGNLRRINVVW